MKVSKEYFVPQLFGFFFASYKQEFRTPWLHFPEKESNFPFRSIILSTTSLVGPTSLAFLIQLWMYIRRNSPFCFSCSFITIYIDLFRSDWSIFQCTSALRNKLLGKENLKSGSWIRALVFAWESSWFFPELLCY